MSEKKTILITGGTGYLGSNIINKYKNKYDFVLIKRKSSNLNRLLPSLKFIKTIDLEDLTDSAIKQLNIDVILHCATHYGRKDFISTDIIEANLLLPLSLISFMSKTDKKVKFINTDTILDKHINVYSLSKAQFKEWMSFFGDSGVYVNVQLEHFYGGGDDKTKFVSYLINSFINEVPSIDLTAGQQNRYFTYIDDVVSAFNIIIDKIDNFKPGLTEFQVSDDEPVNLRSFIEMVKIVTGNKTTKLNFGALPYRKGELMDFKIHCTEIKKLGWKPQITLQQGLLNTIEIDKHLV